ncbi:MAG TPA: transcription antitermination factor NusB [Gemmatimonadales bacterium]|nr:transcription antitermination factor NusB [Gemmatimonadales bacterium]
MPPRSPAALTAAARGGPEGVSARRAAFRILERVRAGQPLEPALEAGLAGLGDADRRLAHELAAGVLRHQRELDAALRPLVKRGWRGVAEPIRTVLRLGAYQLVGLDRVPPHAAVSTSVELAREAGGVRATGFVNAVLRRLAARCGAPAARSPAGEHAAPPAPAAAGGPDAASLAARYSHPDWLVRRWLERFGPEETERLLAWNNTRPELVLQPARRGIEALAAALQAEGVGAVPAAYGAGLVVPRRRPEELPGYAAGHFVVQDPAQALVTWYADPDPGAVVYDACAAPGGKALGLSRSGARVVAGDSSRARVQRLRENLARAGSGRERALVADARHPPVRALDAVLLDAPCLGTGTFARHPDARLRVTPAALGELAARQAELLEAAAGVVRPGGLLVYATCSLEPEENELQVERFLDRHPEFVREPPDGFPEGLLTSKGDLMTLPQRDRMDGAYAARLRRVR